MKKFIAITKESSNKKGYNLTVTVYQVKNNELVYIGYDDEINTASYMGDYAIACHIIHDKLGHKLSKDKYNLASKNIKISRLTIFN